MRERAPGRTRRDPLYRVTQRVVLAGALSAALVSPTAGVVRPADAAPGRTALVAARSGAPATGRTAWTAAAMARTAPIAAAPAQATPAAVRDALAERARRAESATSRAAAAARVAQVNRGKVVAEARKHVGKGYRRGAAGPRAFDCSGLAKRAFAQAGLKLPHKAARQVARGRSVGKPVPGDAAYLGRKRSAYHIGVVVQVDADGTVWIVHAATPKQGVVRAKAWPGLRYVRLIG